MIEIVIACCGFEMGLRRPTPQREGYAGCVPVETVALCKDGQEQRFRGVKGVSDCLERWRGTWAREALRRKFQSTGVGSREHVIDLPGARIRAGRLLASCLSGCTTALKHCTFTSSRYRHA